MHHRAKDLTGLRVGYLTTTRYCGSDGRKSLYEAVCVCGRTVALPGTELQKQHKRGIRASCGCMKSATISAKRTTHGMSKHPVFVVWRSMVDRCTLPSHQAWRNYGGRGVTVCSEWRESFAAFWRDMGSTYLHGLTLERKDNGWGYNASNCTWAPRKRQANNTRRSRVVETPAGKMTVAQAAEAYQVGYSTLLYRLDHGWPVLRALNLSSIC